MTRSSGCFLGNGFLLVLFFLSSCTLDMQPFSARFDSCVEVVDVTGGRSSTYSELVQTLGQARFVLLGEQHDKAQIHNVRGGIVTDLATNKRLLVSFEHVDFKDQAVLATTRSPEHLEQDLNWTQSGWPDWKVFAPLFQSVYSANIAPVAALNRPLDTSALAEFRAHEPLTHEKRLRKLLAHHHLALDDPRLDAMLATQRRWDLSMADSLTAYPSEVAVLLAGNGHVRKDFGVPWYLAHRYPRQKVISVGMYPDEYFLRDVERQNQGLLPFDFVVFVCAQPS